MNADLVSIIIPVYNCEKFIAKCIDCILIQSYNNWELLLINDGSTDNSDIICREYTKKDKRIRYFKKENKGVSNTRNFGIKKARGKWIIFTDSDDLVSPHYITHLINASNGDSYTHVIQGFKCIDENGKFKKWMDIDYNDESCEINEIEPLLEKYDLLNRVQVWGKLFSTEIIRSNNLFFNENISIGEDGIFSHKYFSLAKKIKLSQHSDYFYRNPYLQKRENLTKKNKTTYELYNITLAYKDLSVELISKLNIQNKLERNKSMNFYITNIRLLFKMKQLFEIYSTNEIRKLMTNCIFYKPSKLKDILFKYLLISHSPKLIHYLYS